MRTSYVHVQTPFGRSLGFSAKLIRVHETSGVELMCQMCQMAITFCNKKDKHFNKKLAREQLETKPLMFVLCKDVPKVLAQANLRCFYGSSISQPLTNNRINRFNYVLRRFL